MFGLFKKKGGEAPEEQERLRKDAAQEARGGESPEARAFAAQFLPEELSVLAVTGPNPFAGGPREDGLWVASMGLTAWMEEDGPDLHREEIRLVTLADPRLLGFLRQRALPDFLIKFRARLSADGTKAEEGAEKPAAKRGRPKKAEGKKETPAKRGRPKKAEETKETPAKPVAKRGRPKKAAPAAEAPVTEAPAAEAAAPEGAEGKE